MSDNLIVLQNYQRVLDQIRAVAKEQMLSPEKIKLLAVSKKQSTDLIQLLIDTYPGVLLGENYVQEYAEKSLVLKGDFQVHLIGPLQSNKVKKAVQLFDVIQSVSSWKIAELISKEAVKMNKIQKVYLQVNISKDQDKSGFLESELLLSIGKFRQLSGLEIIGLMTITKYYSNVTEVLPDFEQMAKLRDLLIADSQFESLGLSMGMSADYLLAVKSGADLVRVGTDIFGSREN